MFRAKSVENGESGRKFFFVCWRGLGHGAWAWERAWGECFALGIPPDRREIVRASMAQPSCGSLLFHRMYKKTPEGVFLSDVFRCYYRGYFGGKDILCKKSNAKPANLENKSLALLSPNCLVAKLFISYSICAVKLHVLAFLRHFTGHFHAPVVSPVTGR